MYVFLQGKSYVVEAIATYNSRCEWVCTVSLNVNGLCSPVKQSKILLKLKRENIDIAFSQETHLMEVEHEKLKRRV